MRLKTWFANSSLSNILFLYTGINSAPTLSGSLTWSTKDIRGAPAIAEHLFACFDSGTLLRRPLGLVSGIAICPESIWRILWRRRLGDCLFNEGIVAVTPEFPMVFWSSMPLIGSQGGRSPLTVPKEKKICKSFIAATAVICMEGCTSMGSPYELSTTYLICCR